MDTQCCLYPWPVVNDAATNRAAFLAAFGLGGFSRSLLCTRGGSGQSRWVAKGMAHDPPNLPSHLFLESGGVLVLSREGRVDMGGVGRQRAMPGEARGQLAAHRVGLDEGC